MRLACCLLISLLLLRCGITRDTVQEHRIQKRRHLSGWHLNLKAARHAPIERSSTTPPSAQAASRTATAPVPMPAQEAEASTEAIPPNVPAANVQRPRQRFFAPTEAIPMPTAQPNTEAAEQEEDENIMPSKRWNGLAIPAFLAGLATIALGFSTNLPALAGAVVLTLVLAGWSIARIRRREQAGKGFAMAALLIGVFAGLLTAIAIARYGVDI